MAKGGGAAAERIGRYEILARLGEGATGVVYKARDPELERVVALKTVRPDLALPPAARERFHQEARAAGRLSHPGIVAVHDVIDVAGTPCLVLEYVEGRTLANLVAASGALPPREAVALAAQLSDALAYAHAHGVLHRDIKTANVLVTADGVAKLADFGVARIQGSHVTATGALLGTPSYLPPEQLRGDAVDARSDVFSLGVVLYETLTGVNPFRRDDLAATLYQIAHVEPPPARERSPQVSSALSAVVERAMAKAPERRYQSARAFAEALAQVSEAGAGPDAAEPSAAAAPRGTRPARTRSALVAAVAGGLLLATAGGWLLWPREAGRGAPRAVPGPGPRVEPASEAGTARRVGPTGSLTVTTNPSVEIFLDGAFKGTAGAAPVVIRDAPAGDHLVTLRLGSREERLAAPVRPAETLALTYFFPRPAAPPPGGRRPESSRGASETPRGVREALDEALEASRKALEKLRETLGGGGGSEAPRPAPPPGPSRSER